MGYVSSHSFGITSITAQYGTMYNWVTSSSNDEHRFYLGKSGSNYRCRLYFTVPDTVRPVGKSKLIIGLIADQSWTPNCMRAYLSTKNAPTSDTEHIIGSQSSESDRLAVSYLYSDTNGTTKQTSSMSASNSKTKECYLIFEYNFQPNTTYYIYFFPYASEGATSVTFSGTWCRWRRQSGYLSITLHYNSGAVDIYTSSGWEKAIPYIYNGSAWKQAIPYVYTSSGWKNTC